MDLDAALARQLQVTHLTTGYQELENGAKYMLSQVVKDLQRFLIIQLPLVLRRQRNSCKQDRLGYKRITERTHCLNSKHLLPVCIAACNTLYQYASATSCF